MSDTVLEPEDVRSRVARGAKLLDEKEPSWVRRVHLRSLDMAECDRCILGQIYGNYWDGLSEIDESDPAADGFNVSRLDRSKIVNDAEYAELAEAWRAEVRARKGGAA